VGSENKKHIFNNAIVPPDTPRVHINSLQKKHAPRKDIARDLRWDRTRMKYNQPRNIFLLKHGEVIWEQRTKGSSVELVLTLQNHQFITLRF
jgi:hypothetical protein